MSTPESLTLSPVALRILGTLAEKQRTVPDTYPLTLNSLLAGCNQKTSRHPVMEISEAGALRAIEELAEHALISEVFGGRATRFTHHLEKVLGLPSQSSALLCVLILRGPQTAGELRLNGERLHAFADISSVEAFLQEMAERPQGALVIQLPRAPGSRENRWMHLLGGPPEAAQESRHASSRNEAREDATDALTQRVSALEAEVAELKQRLNALLTP